MIQYNPHVMKDGQNLRTKYTLKLLKLQEIKSTWIND